MDIINQLFHFQFLVRNDLDDIGSRFLIRNQITDTDTIRTGFHIFSHNVLKIIDEIGRVAVTEIIECAVNNTFGRTTQYGFFHLAAFIFSVTDFQYIVGCRIIFAVFKQLGLGNHCYRGHNLRQHFEIGNGGFINQFGCIHIGIHH